MVFSSWQDVMKCATKYRVGGRMDAIKESGGDAFYHLLVVLVTVVFGFVFFFVAFGLFWGTCTNLPVIDQ